MVNEDLIPKTETVYEIKNEKEYQVPSFEEFIKSYENDGSLNYDDLESGSVGKTKGYGPNPIGEYRQERNVLSVALEDVLCQRFFLKIECLNWAGGGGRSYVNSTSEALRYAHRLEDGLYSNVSNDTESKCATLVREAVRHYNNGNEVNGHIKVQGKFWGGYEADYKF